MIKNDSHNHEASKDLSGHPSARVFSEQEIQNVDKMSKSGIPPHQILSSICQGNPNTQVVARNIYNMKRKIVKENLEGRSMIQVLFEELGKAGFTFDVKRDQEGRLTHLFFAHPASIKLSRSYPTVFVMDCTYKTNRYKMPLLEIIGITSFNTSFYSCFAFLHKEGHEDYKWALGVFSKMLGRDCYPSIIVTDRELALMKAIQVVFPAASNLLCVWHIQKNIVSNCKSYFEKNEVWEEFLSAWNRVVYSVTEKAYEKAWFEFELSYKAKGDILNYIRRTWLPYKEQFINAWTEKFLHFRNQASSRAEGAHSKLKKYLLVSTGDILTIKQKMCLLIDNEINEIKVKMSSERLQIPHKCNVPFFKEVVTRLSIFALKELEKQFEMMKNQTMKPVCSDNFVKTMGLPCAHVMSRWKEQALPLSIVHSQWQIDTRESLLSESETNENMYDLDGMLTKLQDSYRQWPLAEKEYAQKKLSELIDRSFSMSFEPSIQRGKGRLSTRRKRKGMSLTTRDPSQFEIVEAALRGRNRLNNKDDGQTNEIATSNLVQCQVSSLTDDGRSINWLDLNVLPWLNDEFLRDSSSI